MNWLKSSRSFICFTPIGKYTIRPILSIDNVAKASELFLNSELVSCNGSVEVLKEEAKNHLNRKAKELMNYLVECGYATKSTRVPEEVVNALSGRDKTSGYGGC